MFEETNEILKSIKKERPLILNITNYVTMDFIANGLLSIGASPVMSKAEEEIHDLLKLTKVAVINLGTLDEKFVQLCRQTCKIANQFNIPIVLDPVGAGASQYRTEICASFIKDFHIAIIRGNASEVMALAGASQQTKGVDSIIESEKAFEDSKWLSTCYETVVAVSGKVDLIVEKNSFIKCERGSPLMPSITGTGCLLTAIIAAFAAIEKNKFIAAKLATLFYGICGEVAAKKSAGPGSFKINFLDVLSFFPERGEYEKC